MLSLRRRSKQNKGIDPYWDPDEMNKTRWFVITIPFDWIAKAWKVVWLIITLVRLILFCVGFGIYKWAIF